MKRLIQLCSLILFLSLLIPLSVLAAETEKPPSHVSITVVMPEAAIKSAAQTQPETKPEPTAQPTPAAPKLYPTDIREMRENGGREIIKTYELSSGEKPSDIPRDSFERDGWLYSLTDIIKKEMASADAREYIELVEQSSATNDTAAILKLFNPSYEFINEEGYMGTMTLDISTLKVETAGTKTTSYTASSTREYPNLSSNDTSLVPKSITDGGRALTLSGVTWKTQSVETVDYNQLPASYTAVATYTAPASKTVITGYIATAEYKGTLSKLRQGKTVYTAYFFGTEIVPERTPVAQIENVPATEVTETSVPEPAADAPVEIPIESEPETENATEPKTMTESETEPAIEIESTIETELSEEEESEPTGNYNPWFAVIISILLALTVGATAGYFIPRVIKNKQIIIKGEETE